ncbi:hypothetical protein RHMOL_Rhmol11G0023700 [Rhododendron molle]|uniref:Uncharacterized protein n=1 Tax=Rhododendron molle TaxID=49168 RepID=A0ACC0LNU7_RHOML|nr:hypothetical protein RHMOL_Rhmol11G0023700 [Rhododendron molle]
MGRPKKLQNVAMSNGTTQAESNDLQFDSTIAIEENTKFTGNQSKKGTYTMKKESTQVASSEKHANNIEEVAFGYDYNMKKDTRMMENKTNPDMGHPRLYLSLNMLESKSNIGSSMLEIFRISDK